MRTSHELRQEIIAYEQKASTARTARTRQKWTDRVHYLRGELLLQQQWEHRQRHLPLPPLERPPPPLPAIPPAPPMVYREEWTFRWDYAAKVGGLIVINIVLSELMWGMPGLAFCILYWIVTLYKGEKPQPEHGSYYPGVSPQEINDETLNLHPSRWSHTDAHQRAEGAD